MRFTDKAAESYLITPKGLSPEVIGKVVTVQVMQKKESYLQPESLVKFVGVLKTYTLGPTWMKFTLEGGSEKSVNHTNEAIEVVLYSGGS